jgi:transcriptional regulator with XRE-family HTH domain
MDLGHRVRDLRNVQHLSQIELAARARVARNTLNRIENGHLMPTAPVIERLAEALGVAPGALFEEPVPKVSAPPEPGRHIRVERHDAVGVSDSVRPIIFRHLDALEATLKTHGLNGELLDMVDEMRKRVAA